uniref:PD-(D/E)XK nuclease superfamily protein n=1 Tax=viral metagenome TaxID=1070528 RepID=A0A6M3IGB9_9ZZZZ
MPIKPKGTRTIYKDSEGTRVPGATTVIGMLAKPALVAWANKLGLQGIDSTKYVDNLADIGTLAHHLILCRHKGEMADTSDYSENQIELAFNCLKSYTFWEDQHTIKPLLVEAELVSETLKYGGTPDLYCELDGELTLLDFKTGKALYSEVMYQLAAYRNLLNDYGYKVDKCTALRIGRDDSEGFEVKVGKDMDTAFDIFMCCLDLYYGIKKYDKILKGGATNDC